MVASEHLLVVCILLLINLKSYAKLAEKNNQLNLYGGFFDKISTVDLYDF